MESELQGEGKPGQLAGILLIILKLTILGSFHQDLSESKALLQLLMDILP
jgi:hypothetical protein